MTLPGFRGAGVLLLGGCQSMIGRTAGRVVSSVTTFNTGFHMDKFARFPHIFVGSSKVQSDLEAGSSSGRFKRSIASRSS
jgi:hypothetical protein